MDRVDELAGALRERLLGDVGEAQEPLALPARIDALVEREAGVLGPRARAELARRVAERAFGLGPLEPLLADPAVDEVMVSGPGRVWVERRGRIEATDVAFASEAELRDVIERILAPLGRRVDEAEPLCDARLPDGSRVNVVIPPLALDGPALTIRRFRRRGLTPAELVATGSWTPALHAVLRAAVRGGAASSSRAGRGRARRRRSTRSRRSSTRPSAS
jgi:pilus assembly protein CpaF